MSGRRDQAESVSPWDFMAGDENDAAGREVARLLVGLYSYTPIAVAIVELGIPGLLAGQALTAEQVASAAGTAQDATARLLRAGMAVGLLAADSSGRFTLTEMGNRLRPGTGSLADLAGFWMAPIRDAMAGLADHVRSGRRVNPAAPGGLWDYLGSHPDHAARFSRAMGCVTSRLLAAMSAAGYRPPPCQRIVDVGGSRGTLLAWFLQAVPGATGVVHDRAESLATAPRIRAPAGTGARQRPPAGHPHDGAVRRQGTHTGGTPEAHRTSRVHLHQAGPRR